MNETSESEGETSAKGMAEAVCDVVDILRRQPASRSDGSDGWDRIVRIVAEHDSLPDSEVRELARVNLEIKRLKAQIAALKSEKPR